MPLPPFITRTKKPRSSRIDSALTEYRPLVGSWLIRMALLLNWHEPAKGERWPAILCDDDFLAVIGIHEDDFQAKSRRTPPSTALCRKILETRLQELESMELAPDSPLFVNQIVHRTVDLEGKIDMIKGMPIVFLTPHATTEELAGYFLRKAGTPTLSLASFPHLAADTAALLDYLKNALEQWSTGVNILLTGRPGVGKTEYAQGLAMELGVDPYEIAYSGNEGQALRGGEPPACLQLLPAAFGQHPSCGPAIRRNRRCLPQRHGVLQVPVRGRR